MPHALRDFIHDAQAGLEYGVFWAWRQPSQPYVPRHWPLRATIETKTGNFDVRIPLRDWLDWGMLACRWVLVVCGIRFISMLIYMLIRSIFFL